MRLSRPHHTTATAVHRRMRGGSSAHLLSATDGHDYVVKVANNCQGRRVLANEWLASRIAHALELPAPPCAIVDVPAELTDSSNFRLMLNGRDVPACPGAAFGSRWAADGELADWIPESLLSCCRNLDEFPGVLAFDKWLCNCDGRQVVFSLSPATGHPVYIVDHGFCFNSGDWNFPDSPMRGVYSRNRVYDSICGWADFQPWLERIEKFPRDLLHAIADEVPTDWYGEPDAIHDLMDRLWARRAKVRDLIDDVRVSPRLPFNNWLKAKEVAA